MAQQPGYSPNFKRPAEILRMRRRRSGLGGSRRPTDSPDQSGSSAAGLRPFSPGPPTHQRAPSRGGTKRRNPFSNLENTHSPKKNRVAEDDGQEQGDSSLTHWLQLLDSQNLKGDEYQNLNLKREEHQNLNLKGEEHLNLNLKGKEHLNLKGEEHQNLNPRGEEHQNLNLKGEEHQNLNLRGKEHQNLKERFEDPEQHSMSPGCDAPPTCKEYPADWSVKTRILFTSPRSLSWTEQPRAQEEALGLHHHCRAHFSTLPHTLSDPRSCSELRAAFQQALVYWQHPSLPWLSLFPRINAERNFSGRNRPWSQDDAVRQSLRKEWSLSLSSLYSLLKSGLCPYFYLCSYQLTVLFRAVGLGGSSRITAILSPTTRGLREAMRADGIEFRVPLMEERSAGRRQRAGGKDDMPEEDADLQSSDGEDQDRTFDWLKEIGVQDKIKKPEGLLTQPQENQAVFLDHKPESVVLVEGLHTFTLINFLINSRSVVATAGSQAGLPPTLLSPVAFRGAGMHMLKSRCVNVQHQVDLSYQNLSSLELTGPVLPSSLHTITKLLQLAQEGTFQAVLSTHRPTAVLNTAVSRQQDGSTPSLLDLPSCGLQAENLQQLQQPCSLGNSALTHIQMSPNGCSWKN